MTTLGFTFYTFVVFLHIAAVVLAFGVTFSYPIADVLLRRPENRRYMPFFHNFQHFIGNRMVFPGALVVLVAGLYLVADGPWSFGDWWVTYGLVAILAILTLGVTVFMPTEARIAPIAVRDVAAAGDGEIVFSDEYEALARRLNIAGPITGLLILSAVFVMVVGTHGGF